MPTLPTEQTDPLAEVAVINQIADLLPNLYAESIDGEAIEVEVDTRQGAEIVARAFTIRYQRRDGLRRTVLYGPWEVDPAAVGDGR